MLSEQQPNQYEWTDLREQLQGLPPSAKFVAKVLVLQGEAKKSVLVDETMLPPRTVRYAIHRLETEGILDCRHSCQDARKKLYYICV